MAEATERAGKTVAVPLTAAQHTALKRAADRAGRGLGWTARDFLVSGMRLSPQVRADLEAELAGDGRVA